MFFAGLEIGKNMVLHFFFAGQKYFDRTYLFSKSQTADD